MAGTETPKAPSYGWSAKVHYSDTLPYGEGDQFSIETYDYELLNKFMKVKDFALHERNKFQVSPNWYNDEKKEWLNYDQQKPFIVPIQQELIKIGYLDPGDDDGIYGPKTEGAIKRYAMNKPSMFEEAWNFVKKLDINPFD